MYKEVWREFETPAGLKYLSPKVVRSRRHRRKRIDLAAWIDKAVTGGMYVWVAILSVFTMMAFIRCI